MIDSETTDLKAKFGDTKFVIMGGSEGRMSSFAKALYGKLKGLFLMSHLETNWVCKKLPLG